MRTKVEDHTRPFIFYDVDGVLNTFTTPEEDKANGMSQLLSVPHVERLKAIRDATNGHLVCVSSWRKYEANVKALIDAGLWDALHTEYDNPALPTRGHEVQDWLDWQEQVNCRRMIILDDKPAAYAAIPDLYTLAAVTGIKSVTGLTGECVQWAIDYLR